MTQFTLVRHGAYADGGNADFEDAVEVRELTGNQAYLVRSAGGALFETAADATQAAQAANYPPGAEHDHPRATGYFSSVRLGGAEIYVPHGAIGP